MNQMNYYGCLISTLIIKKIVQFSSNHFNSISSKMTFCFFSSDYINLIRAFKIFQYTCFNVSKSLIAFGATSGGIYVFNRTPCEFIQLIPNKVCQTSLDYNPLNFFSFTDLSLTIVKKILMLLYNSYL